MESLEKKTLDHAENREHGPEFLTACGTVIQLALQKIEDRFERNKESEKNLAYHNSKHTKHVINTTDTILSSVGADIHARALGRLIASFHDVVQEYEIVDGIRKRDVGNNERKSYEMLEAYMHTVNEERDTEVFSKQDMNIAKEAILGTIPDFVDGTVVQKNLENQTSIIARAVSLADLSTAGTDPKHFIAEGNALFREENPDIVDAIRLKNISTIPETDVHAYRERMLTWTRGQVAFAEGRKIKFEEEIEFDGFSEGGKEKLRELFSQFDTSITLAEAQAANRTSMVFEVLAADMGFEVTV